MNKIFLKSERYVDGRTLCYSVEYNGTFYSLRVEATPAVVESVYVPDVARDAETASKLHDMLSRNLVFPISVYEILDDIIG